MRIFTLSSKTRSPSWFTAMRRPRPISWRFLRVESVSFSVQIWNTFGLSQPSRNAECENMNFSLQSKDNSHSLSFIIVLKADSSSLRELVSFKMSFPEESFFLPSIEKYPLWTSWADVVKSTSLKSVLKRGSLAAFKYSSSNIFANFPFMGLPLSS